MSVYVSLARPGGLVIVRCDESDGWSASYRQADWTDLLARVSSGMASPWPVPALAWTEFRIGAMDGQFDLDADGCLPSVIALDSDGDPAYRSSRTRARKASLNA